MILEPEVINQMGFSIQKSQKYYQGLSTYFAPTKTEHQVMS